MSIFNKAFEQFQQHAFKLAGFGVLYFTIVTVCGLILNCIPIIGTLLYNALVIMGLVFYIRIYMQVVNGQSSLSFDEASDDMLPSAWKLLGFTFIKSLIYIAIIIIPCIIIAVMVGISASDYSSETLGALGILTISMILLIMAIVFVVELMLAFVTFVIADKDFSQMSFKESISIGIKMMKGYRINFLLVQVANVILFIAGILMLGIGLIFTSVLSTLIMLNLYKEAKENYVGLIYCNENNAEIDKDFC